MYLNSYMLTKLLDFMLRWCSKTDERPAIIMNSTFSCIIETNLDYYMFLGYFI